MKVLILTSNYPRKNAVMNGIFIHHQVKALQQLGVECHVLVLYNWYPPFGLHKLHPAWLDGYEAKQNFYNEIEGVKIHAIPVVYKMPDRFFKNDFYRNAANGIAKYIKAHKELQNPDWIYAQFLTDYGYIGTLVKEQLRVKLAAIARGDDIHAWPEQNKLLVKNLQAVFKKADVVLANSKRLADDAKHWMEASHQPQLNVVYNGVDTKYFYPADEQTKQQREKQGLAVEKKYLVCIGTPVALKGWVELLEAIKQVGDKFNGWELLMIAPSRNNADALDLQEMSKALGIEKYTRLIPGIGHEGLGEILRAADAFILPSYNEGMSNALLEAMASGLPCIATNVGGHAEVIDDQKSGLLIEPRSVAAIAGALDKILSNPEFRKELGQQARKKMEEFGDYKKNAERLLALLKNYKNSTV